MLGGNMLIEFNKTECPQVTRHDAKEYNLSQSLGLISKEDIL